jgi:hypothetical protein
LTLSGLAALPAPLGLVPKTFFRVKLLVADGKEEWTAAIFARNRFVFQRTSLRKKKPRGALYAT